MLETDDYTAIMICTKGFHSYNCRICICTAYISEVSSKFDNGLCLCMHKHKILTSVSLKYFHEGRVLWYKDKIILLQAV